MVIVAKLRKRILTFKKAKIMCKLTKFYNENIFSLSISTKYIFSIISSTLVSTISWYYFFIILAFDET